MSAHDAPDGLAAMVPAASGFTQNGASMTAAPSAPAKAACVVSKSAGQLRDT